MADSARAHLIFSFRKVLRPLVKILIRAGVTFPEFRDVIKGAYVEAAVREGIGREGPVSRERIAVHTAVPQIDVDRFIDDPKLLAPPDSTNAAVIAEVLHLWNTDTNYMGPYGLPLEIDFDKTVGRNLSELIYRADPTADPNVIVDEMIETGFLVRVGKSHYKAGARSYLFSDVLTPQALEYFGRVMTDLATTLEFNMAVKNEEKRLQRSVVADGGLPDYAMPEFEALIKDRVQALLVEVDDWLSQNRHRWVDKTVMFNTGLSVFHYVNEELEYQPLNEMPGLAESARLPRRRRRKKNITA
jgi:hypothetical protein